MRREVAGERGGGFFDGTLSYPAGAQSAAPCPAHPANLLTDSVILHAWPATRMHCVCSFSIPLACLHTQISTMCVKEGLLAVGGFHGELVCVRLSDMAAAFSGRVTRSDNGITNGIEVGG